MIVWTSPVVNSFQIFVDLICRITTEAELLVAHNML